MLNCCDLPRIARERRVHAPCLISWPNGLQWEFLYTSARHCASPSCGIRRGFTCCTCLVPGLWKSIWRQEIVSTGGVQSRVHSAGFINIKSLRVCLSETNVRFEGFDRVLQVNGCGDVICCTRAWIWMLVSVAASCLVLDPSA